MCSRPVTLLRATTLCVSLLLASSARAEPAKCNTVKECVRIAERNPVSFTPTLRESLEAFTWGQLLEELDYTHPRAAVTEIVRELQFSGLETRGGHTPETARMKLELALAAAEWSRRDAMLDDLATDRAGARVLVAFIENAQDGAKRADVMLSYVRRHADAAQADERQRIETYHEALWQTYLALPASQDEFRKAYLEYLRWRPVLLERLVPRVRSQVAAGIVPEQLEMVVLIKSLERRSEVLTWAESSVAMRRRFIEALWEARGFFPGFAISPEDFPRARRLFLAELKDGDARFARPCSLLLWATLAGVSEEEAGQIVKAMEAVPAVPQQAHDVVLIALAKRFPAYRAALKKRLLHDEVANVAALVEDIDPPEEWLVQFARKWVRALTDAQLRDPEVQERFRVFTRLLSIRGRHAEMPPARDPALAEPRLPLISYGCGTGEWEAERFIKERRRDLAAFGREDPEGPRVQEEVAARRRLPPRRLKPLTEEQARKRWAQFADARARVVRYLKAGE